MFQAPSTLAVRNSTYEFISPSRHRNRLSNKTVLITGAGRGLGRETVLAFARAGARIICVARRAPDIEAIVSEIQKKSSSPAGKPAAIAITADVSQPGSALQVLDEVKRQWGENTTIDILVANAGMTRFNTFEAEDAMLEDWWRVMSVNLFGTLQFIRAVLPGMRARNAGTIISLASTSGSQDIPFNTAYAASKAAIIKFNQDLGVELEGSDCERAVNMQAIEANPRMRGILEAFNGIEMQTPDLAANTAVALCVEKDVKNVSGRYVDSQQDLEEVLEEARKGDESRIEKERLYWLKMDEL